MGPCVSRRPWQPKRLSSFCSFAPRLCFSIGHDCRLVGCVVGLPCSSPGCVGRCVVPGRVLPFKCQGRAAVLALLTVRPHSAVVAFKPLYQHGVALGAACAAIKLPFLTACCTSLFVLVSPALPRLLFCMPQAVFQVTHVCFHNIHVWCGHRSHSECISSHAPLKHCLSRRVHWHMLGV